MMSQDKLRITLGRIIYDLVAAEYDDGNHPVVGKAIKKLQALFRGLCPEDK
jgi:hypothetical protein